MKRYIRQNTEVLQPYMTGDAVELKDSEQEFTSKGTAVNAKYGKLPVIYKEVKQRFGWKPGTVNLDYGGGTEDADALSDTFFEPLRVTNVVYDKYNQTPEHNQAVVRFLRSRGGADTATLSNVLNVIKESNIREEVISDVYSMLKPNGTLYVVVHEGSKADMELGARKKKEDQWQEHRKADSYITELVKYFPDAYRKGGLIICPKTGSVSSSTKTRRTQIKSSTELITL